MPNECLPASERWTNPKPGGLGLIWQQPLAQGVEDNLEITGMLTLAREGDSEARVALLKAVYSRLQDVARNRLRSAPHLSLRPTELVHEAYIAAFGEGQDFENRRHFFFVAARAMRNILVDSARRKSAKKREGKVAPLNDALDVPIEAPADDMLALHAALGELETFHARAYKMVMLRFFAGLTTAEAAHLLEVGVSTAERDWQFARTFLHEALVRT